MKECVVVLGMHRSGTSVLTGLISILGYYTGFDLMKPTKDNPKGYFENNKIYALNEKILRDHKSKWDDYNFSIEDIAPKTYQSYVVAAKKALQEELKYVKRTVIKDPRLCILYPIWAEALASLKIKVKIIFAYRNPLEVAYSLKQRDEIPLEKGIILWSHYFFQAEKHSRDNQRILVKYSDDFINLEHFLNKLGTFLEMEINQNILDEAHNFYTPSLQHHKLQTDNISDDTPPFLLDIIKLLQQKKLDDNKLIHRCAHDFYRDKNYYLYNEKNINKKIKSLQLDKINLEKKTDQQNNKLKKKDKIIVKKENIIKKKDTQIITQKKEIEKLLKQLETGENILTTTVRNKKIRKKIKSNLNQGKLPLKFKKWHYLLPNTPSKKIVKEKYIIAKSKLFSPFYYLTTYPDIWKEKVDPLEHYCRYGWKEGRNPSSLFSTQGYLEANQDVANYNINPLFHYIQNGRKEGRVIIPVNAFQNNNPMQATVPAIQKYQGDKKHQKDLPSVLLVSHNVSKMIYGGERSFIDMLAAAAKSNVNIIVVLPRHQEESIEYIKQYANSILIFNYRWWKKENTISEESINSFKYIIREYAIDLVHANTIMLREPLIAAKQINIPSIIHIRELVTGDKDLAKIIGKSPKKIIKKINNSSNYLIANSNETAKAYNNKEKITIIHNTVDMDAFNIENKLEKTLKIALISSNIEKKGVFEFLDIAEKCQTIKNIAFVLIGPKTPEITTINQKIASKKLKNIQFLGYKKQAIDAISEANIILSISKFTESFGRTVLEGMAAHRPIIAYRWGAVTELIVNEKTGYLVDYLDTDAIAEKIKYLNTNRDLLQKMGMTGRKRAVEYFGFEQYSKKIKQIYQKILKQQQIQLHRTEKKQQRIAYFLWFFPVPSETFVLNELRVLVKEGYDVMVFCKQSPYPEFSPDFKIQWERVSSPKGLAKKLIATKRTIVHSHFTYPTVTDMVWPACEKAKIHFTFIAHAQDIFRYSNIEKNRIAEISHSKFCKKVLIPSRFHRDYVIEQGVIAKKTFINPNGIDPTLYAKNRQYTEIKTLKNSVCAIHRYTEKKGLENLILSAKHIKNKQLEIHIHGYGDLEQNYKTLIKQQGLNNVHIHGMVKSRDEMLQIFAQNDAFLCPSVRAKDGDMDGIPTVLMEAMAYGIPVISTNLSGIPDLIQNKLTGFITEATPQGIANSINTLYKLPTQQLTSLAKAAKKVIYQKYNSVKLVNSLVRTWSDKKSIDIIIVSWNHLAELKEVIRRLKKYTLSNYNLIISDNNSEPDVRDFLLDIEKSSTNITILLNQENLMVGPGSNIAIEVSSAEYIIYVCGKEGFVFDYQWESAFIDFMDENPKVGLGGTLCYSPSYPTGKSYPQGIALFSQFRNQHFALENPERAFNHIQGGFFIIRREMYQQIGGFSEAVKHQYTDVEYSYYAESCGWKLGAINGMISLYNKSRPTIFSRMNTSIKAIHPPTLEQLPLLEDITQAKTNFCNLCQWQGKYKEQHQCPACHSSADDRSLYRYLAESRLTYQRLNALAIGLPSPLKTFWQQQFQGDLLSAEQLEKQLNTTGKLKYNRLNIVYYHNLALDNPLILQEIQRLLAYDKGVLLLQYNQSVTSPPSLEKAVNTLSLYNFHLKEEINYSCYSIQYGWNIFWVFEAIKG